MPVVRRRPRACVERQRRRRIDHEAIACPIRAAATNRSSSAASMRIVFAPSRSPVSRPFESIDQTLRLEMPSLSATSRTVRSCGSEDGASVIEKYSKRENERTERCLREPTSNRRCSQPRVRKSKRDAVGLPNRGRVAGVTSVSAPVVSSSTVRDGESERCSGGATPPVAEGRSVGSSGIGPTGGTPSLAGGNRSSSRPIARRSAERSSPSTATSSVPSRRRYLAVVHVVGAHAGWQAANSVRPPQQSLVVAADGGGVLDDQGGAMRDGLHGGDSSGDGNGRAGSRRRDRGGSQGVREVREVFHLPSRA